MTGTLRGILVKIGRGVGVAERRIRTICPLILALQINLGAELERIYFGGRESHE
jgi:hypothetical protein